ncbi:hypothetical protein IWQ60_006035 [Tieghemiomyces parasiticus]|uniref:Nudix hydrolase domain-containing protein n=1 Tax=Tieghemiomyces parasiticus TaxID=78921 RepID=A0A9W8DYC2_9FUNG|nr:hypothetical protein IWQ60_006035 [Tieghemiomyces parasiticus]
MLATPTTTLTTAPLVKEVRELLDAYLVQYPEERDDVRVLLGQLANPDEDVLTRRNFTGHVTASAFVVHHDTKSVLLLQHLSLGRLLQPGGHVDHDDPGILAAAMREVSEETSLRWPGDLKVCQPTTATRQQPSRPAMMGRQGLMIVPFDVDVHYIPPNPKKGEPGHWHHDFRYLVTTDRHEVAVNPQEAAGYSWTSFDEFSRMPGFRKVAVKIAALLPME